VAKQYGRLQGEQNLFLDEAAKDRGMTNHNKAAVFG